MKKIGSYFVMLGACVLAGCSKPMPDLLTSPDKQLHVKVFVTEQNTLAYAVDRAAQPVILESDLGLELTAADFTRGVAIESQSSITPVTDDYSMRVGKKSKIAYRANEQTFVINNAQQQKLNVTFRVSNDGVAFRYAVTDPVIAQKQFVKETTSFNVAATAKAWLQPMAVAQTGWSNTNPSYEEHYQSAVSAGTESTLKQGWVFPALFNAADHWLAISETGMDGTWHGSHLQLGEKPGEYTIAPPQTPEVFISGSGEKGALLANASGTFESPWRIIALGSLAQLMESTLGTDLAAPAIPVDYGFIKPGHSSWSWAILKDDFTTFDVQKKFIDYAADMHWDYTLIDADWDKKIGYEKLQELVDYAAEKNIGVLVWYNSSGDWNETPYSPKSQLITHEQRVAEFSRLQKIGVKGVKIDFFGGDGQSFMQYYIDILQDAAAHHLLVNFHGATLPRGWQRTYPNLMTMESIKGFEFTTFSQADQDPVAAHVVTALFARNLFDPMDYTPMAFGDIPNIKRVTENSFELAESVLMISGIQHFAEIPEGMATAPEYVKDFLRELPREWDDVKFIDGYPGKFVVLARKAGDAWYIAGINAEAENKILNFDLNFAGDKPGILITSGDTERSFVQQEINSKTPQTITLRPSAGFVMVLK
ncbi:MAG: glycoside hydrolase family 97 catalytic domain-containing protein [Cellvibrio sp.]|uniref:glycoside hydrolase family 97 protein n=1 Tax=Cellvibrio sp. TaxID=1965322 RepID=UPI00271C6130|nr:glycoside hydrolase family 97 catalytic domain-containing protein [Cellvibrio sp.]